MHHATRSPRRVPSPSILICTLLLISATASASSVRATPVATMIPTAPAVWTFSGVVQDEELGTSVAAAGDVNGDGFADVIVGAPGWGPATYAWWGRALVFLGGRDGLSSSPAWSLLGTHYDGGLGYSVAGAGDVNGDGFADVIVGEYGFSGGMPYRGRAWIVPGSKNGPRTNQTWDITGDSTNAYLGEFVAAAGDVNGDGYDDVFVGGVSFTALYLGRPGGIERRPAWSATQGYLVASAGDVNRDGYDDVLVGGADTKLYLGSPGGLSPLPAWTGPPARAFGGRGDVNGDGYDDLLLSTYCCPVLLYPGSAQGPAPTPAWTGHSPTDFGSDEYGIAVSITGDVNGDGYSDVLVSHPRYTDPSSLWRPSVFIYLGGPGGPSTSPDWMGTQPYQRYAGSSFGRSASLCQDVNDDGVSEIIVGEYNITQGGVPGAGRVLLYAPGPGLPAPTLVHEPVYSAAEGAPITLEATASDQTHYVARVEIRYRWIEDLDFRPPLAMTRISEDHYRGSIPPSSGWSSGLLYSIRAVDDYGQYRETFPIGVEYIETAGSTRFAVRVVSATPGHPSGIAFTTSKPGPARVRVYDVQGRLVTTVLDEARLPAGRHTASLLGMRSAAAGVYFFRVETAEGTKSGRIAILR